MNALERHLQRFRRLALLTFFLLFAVVFAGAAVRILEAGMGCPDWPTCYGQLIPPVYESQLPPDYRQRFAVGGKLAEPFDPLKTWAEYLNRLLAIVAGIGILGMVAYSWVFLRTQTRLLFYTTALPILLLLQALLGWRVVATYLAERMITLHMIFTLALTLCTLLAWAQTFPLEKASLRGEWRIYYFIGAFSWVALLIQILSGASVRAAINQAGWETAIYSPTFYFHRSFSWIVLGLWAYYHWRLYREPVRQPLARQWAIATTLLLTLQVLLGAFLRYIAFTGVGKILHLWIALLAANTAFLSLYFFQYSVYGSSRKPVAQPSL
ncbi:MAG: COX15/CtaA family protein [Bacteroidia bacterium]|nr:COX15/CtaA family protein [Bacteroidia bacterium]MDW8088136.1 COX15/CtaA family protein [Bacteroidia bacterium]